MIDLDKANVKEYEGENFNFDEQFKLKLLFEYKAADVDHKSLTNIHARGLVVRWLEQERKD